ncbi:GNAT family N-acetyltransferase [Amycolatopsis cynarae]|uniref:GNAT family N-acetyltransferase n=1 Tax=Amycolatopsis cynarae TaxID=2995223 RepID=A0ABY7B3M1_9PSEU|nr:GNAT family N-acetyltransferase [Amycolatopsis sp. HUAS 11-8]WAL66915.1 GNAT family N-acetyltransferase [Amycolatopsis sp. HUAS 11-8]
MDVDNTTVIRFAEVEDAESLARIHVASRAATMPYLPAQRYTLGEVIDWIRDVVLRTCRTTVAVRRDEVVGYAAVEGDVLEQLYVRPDLLRQGIGTLLLDEVLRDNSGGVSLRVFQQNTDARAFYQRHGFDLIDTSDGSHNMEGLPDMVLRWTP